MRSCGAVPIWEALWNIHHVFDLDRFPLQLYVRQVYSLRPHNKKWIDIVAWNPRTFPFCIWLAPPTILWSFSLPTLPTFPPSHPPDEFQLARIRQCYIYLKQTLARDYPRCICHPCLCILGIFHLADLKSKRPKPTMSKKPWNISWKSRPPNNFPLQSLLSGAWGLSMPVTLLQVVGLRFIFWSIESAAGTYSTLILSPGASSANRYVT